jgi:hypothetical protein
MNGAIPGIEPEELASCEVGLGVEGLQFDLLERLEGPFLYRAAGLGLEARPPRGVARGRGVLSKAMVVKSGKSSSGDAQLGLNPWKAPRERRRAGG